MIIGVSGKAEAGKDLIAAHLVQAHGFTRRAFADALKLQWLAIHHLGLFNFGTEGEKLAFVNYRKKHSEQVRSELQAFGQAKRAEDPLYWTRRTLLWAEARKIQALVIPDVRYRDEARAIKDRGGLVLRVERPGHQNRLTPEQRSHSSECDLDDYEGFDEILVNMDTPDKLLESVDWFLHDFAEVIYK